MAFKETLQELKDTVKNVTAPAAIPIKRPPPARPSTPANGATPAPAAAPTPAAGPPPAASAAPAATPAPVAPVVATPPPAEAGRAAPTSVPAHGGAGKIARLYRDDTVLLVVDVQDRLLSVIDKSDRLVDRCMLLAGAARELGLPVVMTEQYPEKLGHTERHLAKAAQSLPIAKMLFSACTEQTLSVIRATGRRSVLLCGIEAHVCVLQSALDLLEQGFTVFVAEDAIASRRKADRRIGWQRMLGAGALPTSTESAIFELLREAGTDEFRALLPLLKE